MNHDDDLFTCKVCYSTMRSDTVPDRKCPVCGAVSDVKEEGISSLPKARGGLYRHYKGGLYWVPGIVGIEEETGWHRVIYFSLSKRVWWLRPYEVFFEETAAAGGAFRFMREGGHFAALVAAIVSNRGES